jgi:hypothetical protein
MSEISYKADLQSHERSAFFVSPSQIHRLHVTNGDQATPKIFAKVGFAAHTNAVGQEGLNVETWWDVEIGNRRAFLADQEK